MTLRGNSNKNDASSSSAAGSSSNTSGERHGSTESSGAESWRSDDTVRGPFGSGRGTPMKVNTNKKLQYVFLYPHIQSGGGVESRVAV